MLHVEFEKNRGMLKGVLCFFKNFELKGGELLVFEYFGRSNINVYILGANCSEINYPNNMFQWFECLPSLGKYSPSFMSHCSFPKLYVVKLYTWIHFVNTLYKLIQKLQLLLVMEDGGVLNTFMKTNQI